MYRMRFWKRLYIRQGQLISKEHQRWRKHGMNCSHRFPFTWQNKALRRRIHLWMFLFPSFLGTMVFMILPFGDVIRRSFLTVVTQKWVGLQNYRTLFQNQAFCLAVKNTLRFTGVCIPLLLLLMPWDPRGQTLVRERLSMLRCTCIIT